MNRFSESLELPAKTNFAVPLTSREKLPRSRFAGIYFLYVKGDLIYIGSSINISKRLTTHGSSDFTHYRYVRVRSRDLLLKLERRYLVKYKPPRNSPKLYASNSTSPYSRVGFYVELPRKTIKEINRRTSIEKTQWQVVHEAIQATT